MPTTTSEPDVEATQCCNFCARLLPVEYFRRKSRKSEQRHSQCRDCHTAYRREYERKKRHKHIVSVAGEIVNSKRDRNLVILLVHELNRRFKGTAAVAELWSDATTEAVARGRSYTSFRLLQGFLELAVVARELREEQMEDSTQNELQQYITAETLQLIREKPEIAVSAAESIGWTVLPPGGSESNRD